jgi:RNA polymerase sigma factor (sigma-70 family)
MSPPLDVAVTRWVHALQKDREPEAAQQLWDAYFERLVALALDHLRTHRSPRPALEDCEDVAISAFHSFCEAASAGRFPQLEDRDDLWLILVVITRRKAARLIEREGRQKRGGQWNRAESSVDQLAGREPGPEEAAITADLYRTLFARLGDDRLRAATKLRMEGWTVAEVAEFLGCSIPTIDRRLRYVRNVAQQLWGPVFNGDESSTSRDQAGPENP